MQRVLRRHGPWLCVLALVGMLVQGMVKYAAPAPRWDMAAWSAALALAAFTLWRVRRAPGPGEREARSSRWHYGRGLMFLIGPYVAGTVICAPLGAGASDFTPKVQRILEADPVVRPAEVIEVTEVTGGDGGRGAQERDYTVRHRLRFDSGTRTVESTVGSFSEIEPGRTVWVLYDPARPGLGRQAELGRDQLEALQGGPAEPFWTVLTACHLGIAGMFAASALFGTNKPVRDGSRRGSLRCAAAVSRRTGIARHRPPERTTRYNGDSERPEKSRPFLELALQEGATVRLFVEKDIEPGALARQLREEPGTLYWDGVPPVRGADSTWALFVLDSGEEIPGVVQGSEAFDWQTAGTEVDRSDTRPLERRPVVHPVTWQPHVQGAAVPFLAVAVGCLFAYGCLGSWIALVIAWTMLPLALFAIYIARGMYLDENLTEEVTVDMEEPGRGDTEGRPHAGT